MFHTADQGVLIKNLSVHLAANEEVAHSLLFQGSSNRKIAETSMNMQSSRSHAIFTITLTVKKPEEDLIIKLVSFIYVQYIEAALLSTAELVLKYPKGFQRAI